MKRSDFGTPSVALVAWTNFNSRTVELRPSERQENLLFPIFPFLPSPLFFLSFLSLSRLDQSGKFPPTFLLSSFHMPLVPFSFSFSLFFLSFFFLFLSHRIVVCSLFFFFLFCLIPSERKLPLTFLHSPHNLTHGSTRVIQPSVMCHLLHHMAIMQCVHLLRCHVASTWSSHVAPLHVSPDTRCLEKHEISIVSKSDEIRLDN